MARWVRMSSTVLWITSEHTRVPTISTPCKFLFIIVTIHPSTNYLFDSVFTTNKKTDVFMSTTQIDNCCKVIETHLEFPSDEYLIKLVKIQQLAQTISVTMAADGMAPMSLPLIMVIQSFQDQLDTFKASLSPRLAQNRMLSIIINLRTRSKLVQLN